jgi:hypothetical protein
LDHDLDNCGDIVSQVGKGVDAESSLLIYPFDTLTVVLGEGGQDATIAATFKCRDPRNFK